jgi:hypothetical protein
METTAAANASNTDNNLGNINLEKALSEGRQQSSASTFSQPFTNRTIIVTATSGVAATLINGETIHHSACYINRRSLSSDSDDFEVCREAFRSRCLLIIDEIVFAKENGISQTNRLVHYSCITDLLSLGDRGVEKATFRFSITICRK